MTTSTAPEGETRRVSRDARAERRIEYSFRVRLSGSVATKAAPSFFTEGADSHAVQRLSEFKEGAIRNRLPDPVHQIHEICDVVDGKKPHA